MLDSKNYAPSDASTGLLRIQDYLDLDRPNHVAIKLASLPYFAVAWTHSDRQKSEALRQVALMVARYGDFVERQYSKDDRRRAEQLLFYRGVPLVEKPECIERGAYRIWYGHVPRLETFAGEQALTLVVHTKETEPPAGQCPLFVDDAIANCELMEHVLGHWECIVLNVNGARSQDLMGVASMIFDVLPDILPDYMDAATLPEGHSKPVPTGVLNQNEYDFWQRRAPQYTSYERKLVTA